MPKIPRITAKEAEKMLLKSGFEVVRSKGSHRIYQKGKVRVVIPHHSGKILHPKCIRQVMQAINKDK